MNPGKKARRRQDADMRSINKPGILYGVGVGVGNPEMMTIKAARILMESDLICIPCSDKEKCRAFRIAESAVPEIKDKDILGIDIEMSKDRECPSLKYGELYDRIKNSLLLDKMVSYITIGDPSIYSSFANLSEMALEDGFEVRIISGVNSFCSCAASLRIPLCMGDDELHIIPYSEDIEESLTLPGTKVIMKCGKYASRMKQLLLDLERDSREKGRMIRVYGVAECESDEETLYYGADQLPEDGNYMMTIIIKENVRL